MNFTFNKLIIRVRELYSVFKSTRFEIEVGNGPATLFAENSLVEY